MPEEVLKISDVEGLINSYNFLSLDVKKHLHTVIYDAVVDLNDVTKEDVLRNMYNVFSIVGKFHCEELFKAGRITFRDDQELIFDTLIGPHITYTEFMLFSGCTIAKGDGSTFLIINNDKHTPKIETICKNFDFDRLVADAITVPQISIIINVGFYPQLIDEILMLLK